MLIIVCGLQGCGKTYVARKVAGVLGAELLRTDVIRKDLRSETNYSNDEIQSIYRLMFTRAEEIIKTGGHVVLDATFSANVNRNRARELADTMGVHFEMIEVVCEESVVEQRINNRYGDESEARFDVYLQYKPLFDPITGNHHSIDNSGTTDETDSLIESVMALITDGKI